ANIKQPPNESIDTTVLEIITNVQKNGDQALIAYTNQFDQVDIKDMKVSSAEMEEALNIVDPKLYDALLQAKKRIVTYHEAQKEQSWFINQPNGVMLGQKVTPLD